MWAYLLSSCKYNNKATAISEIQVKNSINKNSRIDDKNSLPAFHNSIL